MKKLYIFLIAMLTLNIANAQVWFPVGIGPTNRITALAVYNSELYAGGLFYNLTDSTRDILKWNGTVWSSANRHTTNNVYSLAVYNSELYAGGHQCSDTLHLCTISKLNGTNWSAVGTGMDNQVATLAVFNGELYAGGSFIVAGGNSANRVAKWNGTNWFALGTGMNNVVSALCVYNGELYAGGVFTTADNNVANYIAKLNNSAGINDNETQELFNIYPNPVNNNLTIETPDKAIIEILNIEGQIVKTINTAEKQTTIDLRNLSSGVYIIKAKTERGVAVKKFIKE